MALKRADDWTQKEEMQRIWEQEMNRPRPPIQPPQPDLKVQKLMDMLQGLPKDLPVNNTPKKEEDNMAEILVLANYNRNTGAETLVGFFDDEASIQAALKEIATFRIDGTEVSLSRDMNFRVHRFKTNMRIVTEKLPNEVYDHDVIVAYFTVLSSNGRDSYGIAVDNVGVVQGCTCMSWEKNNYAGDACKHMNDLQKELNSATGRKKIGWTL